MHPHHNTTLVLTQLLLSHLQAHCNSPDQDDAIEALERVLMELHESADGPLQDLLTDQLNLVLLDLDGASLAVA